MPSTLYCNKVFQAKCVYKNWSYQEKNRETNDLCSVICYMDRNFVIEF